MTESPQDAGVHQTKWDCDCKRNVRMQIKETVKWGNNLYTDRITCVNCLLSWLPRRRVMCAGYLQHTENGWNNKKFEWCLK
jgi:hypothetical protein